MSGKEGWGLNKLTDRILIELLEYVRLNWARPMPSAFDLSLGDRCFCLPLTDADIAREARVTNEREDGGLEDSGEAGTFS